MALYKTGRDRAPVTGTYEFVRYVRNSQSIPPPTTEERRIPLKRDAPFPPVRSTGEAAWWRRLV